MSPRESERLAERIRIRPSKLIVRLTALGTVIEQVVRARVNDLSF